MSPLLDTPLPPVEAVEFKTSQGQSLRAFWQRPAGPGPHPSVVCIHGLTLTQRIFEEAALALAAQGIASLRVDLRGHGASDGALVDQGFDDQLADVRASFQHLSVLPGADPARRGILGFSMGAALGVLVAQQEGPACKAMALWAPLLKTGPWSTERFATYGEPVGDVAKIWDDIAVSRRLFSEALMHDPYQAAVDLPQSVLFCHGGKDRNHPQARSAEAAEERLKAMRPVATYFPPQSGHRFLPEAERRMRDRLTAAFFGAVL
jgi:alpha-beta hydrolase superfamily lysophospholipase